MARDSKGQQVKTFKHFEPQPDGTTKEVIGKVYFNREGKFDIYLPQHISDGIKALTEFESGRFTMFSHGEVWCWNGRISNPTCDGVMAGHKHVLAKYTEQVKQAVREKVIKVTYHSNLRADREDPAQLEHHATYRNKRKRFSSYDDLSQCGSPALELHYRILYRVGDALYELHDHPAWGDREAYETMQYVERVGEDRKDLIPWTQEREDFLAQMVAGLGSLIRRLDVFFHVPENLDLAIASGAVPMLEAPRGDRHEETQALIDSARSPEEVADVIDGEYRELPPLEPLPVRARTRTRRR